MIGHEGAFLDRAVEGCPYGGDRQGNQHDDSDNEHDQVLHQAVVEKGFLILSFEDEVDGIDQIGEQKTRRDKRTGQSEPSQVGDVLGKLLDPFEEIRVQLGEKFFGKDVEAPDREF